MIDPISATGAPERLAARVSPSIVEYLDHWAAAQPDTRYCAFLDVAGRVRADYRYAQFRDRTARLARHLAEAWPRDVSRDALVARAFRARRADESHRARLRVEIGRLRAALRKLADVAATKQGFALQPRRAREVLVLARPVEEEHADVLAFLADGESWSSSALALALGASQRTVQRALDALAAAGTVHAFGRGRARRWTTPPVPGFTTTLLLPAPLPAD